MNEIGLHKLEAELALLLKTRSEIDLQISEVEKGIARFNQPTNSGLTQLFKMRHCLTFSKTR